MARHLCILLVDGFSHLAFSCAIEPLRLANRISGAELYRFSLASEDGSPATCLNGLKMEVQASPDTLPRCDSLFVLASEAMAAHADRKLLGALRRARAQGIPVGGLCSGAWILAEAGLLTGRRAALHWDYHDSFTELFPEVDLVQTVFVDDPKHPTAAGGTATADYMLHVIERDHGPDLATAIADQMVYSGVRSDTVEQRVSLQARLGMRNPHLARAIQIMRETIEDPVPPSCIAERIGISPRQLERLFARFMNATPKKFYVDMRLERARKLLLQTEASVIEVGLACGFDSPSHFSRLYKDRFGLTPTHQRNKLT